MGFELGDQVARLCTQCGMLTDQEVVESEYLDMVTFQCLHCNHIEEIEME